MTKYLHVHSINGVKFEDALNDSSYFDKHSNSHFYFELLQINFNLKDLPQN